jgi:2-dehydro-3-deoxy-D-arabinonate dehydratase
MKLCKFTDRTGHLAVGRIQDDYVLPLALSGGQYRCLADILEADNPLEVAEFLTDRSTKAIPLDQAKLRAPIDQQEVWAAGVTYKRSKAARMEESAQAASAYDRVYVAARPELFFKATPHRVAGHLAPVRIRQDSKWNVPEPELALVLNSHLRLVGFTIGNDMSSRDIEGENPLYLPQAKVYNACCALGPWISLPIEMPPREEIRIEMKVYRGDATAFEGRTTIAEMARTFEDLIGWLGRDNSFPHGAFLLTGTGIVPDSKFTLHAGDMIEMTMSGIGTMRNPVVQG